MKTLFPFLLFSNVALSQLNERWVLVDNNTDSGKSLFTDASFYPDGTFIIQVEYDSIVVSFYELQDDQLTISYFLEDIPELFYGEKPERYLRVKRYENFAELYHDEKRLVYKVFPLNQY